MATPIIMLAAALPALARPSVCVLPPTIQILLNATCGTLAPLASPSFDLAGMAGEKEHAQLLLRTPPSSPPMTITSVTISLGETLASVRQVAYVNAQTTSRYIGSGGGWRPDPLLPLDSMGTLLEPGVATPLWLSVRLPSEGNITEGEVSITVTDSQQTVQRLSVAVKLTVWQGLSLPSALDLHREFGEIWSFEIGDLQTLYGANYSDAAADRFRAMNTEALLPPDNLYKRTPDPPAVYQYLRSSGAYLLNIADIGTDARGCPAAYTPADVEGKLSSIALAIEALGEPRADFRPYVYGFDEQPRSCEENIRKLFGAVKARWPHVATAAVLNWPEMPIDLPVDVWIVQYGVYNATQAAAWQGAGKQLFGYHCIEPSGPTYLNTFIERPRTQGRLLYWWAADRNVDGWLYYATDIWRPRPGSSHVPIRRIGRSPRTDFDPSNYIWSPRTDIFANGDGQFVYPGLEGAPNRSGRDATPTPAPVASARLELQRDAVEDMHLLRLARKTLGAATVSRLIRKLVRSPTDHTDDPALLEATRREIAAELVRVRDAAQPSIATPSAAQYRYQATDFIALIHFNMATFAHNGDPGCDISNWDVKAPYATGKTRDPATFSPALLNTSQWMESIVALGANIAILTAKHGCGFLLWPTNSTLPDGTPYGYNVGAAGAAIQSDVLAQFVASAKAAGVGFGFYYSIMKSFYLCHSFSGTNSCGLKVLPGQRNFTDAQYKAIVTSQLTELWTRYGPLTEVWVDSPLGGFEDLMVRLQPQAVGTPANPTGWCGTESGHPSKDVGGADVWSTGGGFHGDPNSPQWIPKFCDPQLFVSHTWFWEPGLAVRTLAELIPIYHDIVGRGMVMELAFSIDRDGLVQDTHAKVYKQLGEWARACYGTPISSTGPGSGGTFTLRPLSDAIDRVQVVEAIALGQRVRNYSIEVSAADGPTGDTGARRDWVTLVRGAAIGRKRIHLLPATVSEGSTLRLRIDGAIAAPQLESFAAFAPCPVK